MHFSFRDFSFKEKSLLISFLAVVGLYGAYFAKLLTGDVEPSLSAMLGEMIGIVVALIIVHSVYHAVISLDDQPTRDDERDRAIDRRATSISHLLLVVGVITITARVIIAGARAETSDGPDLPLFEVANLLLLALVVSEAIHYAAQLFYYRRGL